MFALSLIECHTVSYHIISYPIISYCSISYSYHGLFCWIRSGLLNRFQDGVFSTMPAGWAQRWSGILLIGCKSFNVSKKLNTSEVTTLDSNQTADLTPFQEMPQCQPSGQDTCLPWSLVSHRWTSTHPAVTRPRLVKLPWGRHMLPAWAVAQRPGGSREREYVGTMVESYVADSCCWHWLFKMLNLFPGNIKVAATRSKSLHMCACQQTY